MTGAPDRLLCSAEELAAEADRLLEFTRASAVEGGFGWLDNDGAVEERDLQLWITGRMTHVCALGHLLGKPGFLELVEHGVEALGENFHDDEFGGWYAAISPDGERPTGFAKEAYAHSFVILAASSAQLCQARGADDLLSDALAVHDHHFWDDAAGMTRESFSANWRSEEAYRGINANMHTVEAFLAAGDVTGDERLHHRAGRIVTRTIDGFARGNGWRIPEHFTPDWEPMLEHNRDDPAHPFRPYGSTIGHGLEWTRLTLATAASIGGPEWDWATPAAVALAERAIADGWAADGHDGFIYTTDWSGAPVTRARMHWVVTEALGAAWALHHVTGDARWPELFGQWWDYAKANLVDHERGSWHAELAPGNTPAAGTWSGKPDTYHAVQAMLLPRLPLTPSFASALAARPRS
ncbi:AGE family epimerase/isomerase [Nostocoides vanveenii]|uniref:AGE family epimerase/isomerase n=1 Tax=Nostocoides vanveenii TaxID=330835 RepID=A0ABP4WHI8_9MICO